MFIDEATGKVLVLVTMFVVSGSLVAGSRHQPFPEISGRFGWLLLTVAGLVALGESAPRPMPLVTMLTLTLGLGSAGVLVGVHHMVRTRRDVFIAPMSGFLFFNLTSFYLLLFEEKLLWSKWPSMLLIWICVLLFEFITIYW